MLTSDHDVVSGTRYRIEMNADGKDPIVLDLDSETFGILVERWRELEREAGQRLCIHTALECILLRARAATPKR